MSGRTSRAWIEVNLAAIVQNARAIARVTGTRLLPIVKANAYGTGAVAVSGALESLDPWGYGVATLEEGATLRAGGITRPILVLMPAHPGTFEGYRTARLTPVLTEAATIRAWLGAKDGRESHDRSFHLEIDTGMGRSGVRWDEVAQLGDLLDAAELEGCFTHFHSADATDGSAEAQLERFQQALGHFRRRPPLVHVANSAAALRGGQSFAFDAVRPGVYLYGGSPGRGLPEGAPVVALRSRVLSARPVRRGETVSYNASWRAPRDTTIATLGIGYADGLRRGLSEGGRACVLLRGVRCPVIGLVNMDFTMVETSGVPVAVGDVATFIGEADGQRISLEQAASWSGELQRELLTHLGPRLERVYV
jgi:alanine racemase